MRTEKKLLVVDRVFKSLSAIGIKQVDLASKYNLSKAAVHQWRNYGIPSDYCVDLEEMLKNSSDPVKRSDMRPDDWHKWWPELAKKSEAA